MITTLLVSVSLIIGGGVTLIQTYDLFESEIARTLIIAAYGLFTVFLLTHWFVQFFIESLI
ncbi:hypothetical protein [Virgibacillus siamensis]|uniref:hypothetical protein n=1 Tax=Virgibacillus siamensis TaxID=480071 RepID=UPI0009876FBD|nr:hypothetical protein [Virgibacillus siamensis]